MCKSVRQSSRGSAPKNLMSTKSIYFILGNFRKFDKHILEEGWWKPSLQTCSWRELCSGQRDGKRKYVSLGRPMGQVFAQRCQFEDSSQPPWQIVKNVFYVGIKCQLDATEVFIADLIACLTCFGHHYAHQQELESIIQWLLPVVFRAVVFKLLVWCGAEGYVSGLQDAAASCKPDT